MRRIALRTLLSVVMLLPVAAHSAVRFIFPNLEMEPSLYFQLSFDISSLNFGTPSEEVDFRDAVTNVRGSYYGTVIEDFDIDFSALFGKWTGERSGSHVQGRIFVGFEHSQNWPIIADFSFGRVSTIYEFRPEWVTRVFDSKYIRIVDPELQLPVPGSAGLLGASLIGFAASRRRLKA